MSEVTRLLSAVKRGKPCAAEQLLPLVYDELRRLAAQKLAQEKPGQTLQATALVHEAYTRLVGGGGAAGQELRWDSRGHFLASAAEAMRRILIDRAREKRSQKRGGGRKKLDIDAVDLATQATPDQLLALDEALAKLAREGPAAARLVELRYFAGLAVEEAGKALGMSTATAYRHWNTSAPGSTASCWGPWGPESSTALCHFFLPAMRKTAGKIRMSMWNGREEHGRAVQPGESALSGSA
jgi:RNA polymerase sigma factor (TIGR02999 family)